MVWLSSEVTLWCKNGEIPYTISKTQYTKSLLTSFWFLSNLQMWNKISGISKHHSILLSYQKFPQSIGLSLVVPRAETQGSKDLTIGSATFTCINHEVIFTFEVRAAELLSCLLFHGIRSYKYIWEFLPRYLQTRRYVDTSLKENKWLRATNRRLNRTMHIFGYIFQQKKERTRHTHDQNKSHSCLQTNSPTGTTRVFSVK